MKRAWLEIADNSQVDRRDKKQSDNDLSETCMQITVASKLILPRSLSTT